MKLKSVFLALCFGALLGTSCTIENEDSSTYPSLISELADLETNAQGVMHRMLTDGGEQFFLSNPKSGYIADAVYRGLCGYTKIQGSSKPMAQLSSLRHVVILRDSTERPQKADPVKVVSTWRGGEYINLHLAPKTQGGIQHWGFRKEGMKEENGKKHLFLSLHHNQNNDRTSYTETVYASLWLEALKEISKGDSITLAICTQNGFEVFKFVY